MWQTTRGDAGLFPATKRSEMRFCIGNSGPCRAGKKMGRVDFVRPCFPLSSLLELDAIHSGANGTQKTKSRRLRSTRPEETFDVITVRRLKVCAWAPRKLLDATKVPWACTNELSLPRIWGGHDALSNNPLLSFGVSSTLGKSIQDSGGMSARITVAPTSNLVEIERAKSSESNRLRNPRR